MFSKEITFVCMCTFACGVVKLEILRLTKAIFPARALFCFYQLSVTVWDFYMCVCVCVCMYAYMWLVYLLVLLLFCRFLSAAATNKTGIPRRATTTTNATGNQ